PQDEERDDRRQVDPHATETKSRKDPAEDAQERFANVVQEVHCGTQKIGDTEPGERLQDRQDDVGEQHRGVRGQREDDEDAEVELAPAEPDREQREAQNWLKKPRSDMISRASSADTSTF